MARGDITGELIQHVFGDDASGKMFEEFFRRLLEAELRGRHVGTAKIYGPTRSGKADGGSDLTVVVEDEPKISQLDFGSALTWDERGRTWYTLKNGANWPKLVKRDIGYGKFIVNPDQRRPKGLKPPTEELLEHVASGGRYVIVVSQQEGENDALLTTVDKTFQYWLSDRNMNAPANLREQLTFVSANDLASFIRDHENVNLPTTIAERLGLNISDGLRSWAQWSAAELVRGRTAYQVDQARRRIIELIQAPAPSRILRIFGPPGVGKTRLVYQALEHTNTDRIRYTDVVAVGRDIVRTRWLEQDAGALTLIVDEVTSYDAQDIMREFRVKASAGACLILIGVTDEDAREEQFDDGQTIRLGDLSSEQMRALVEAEFGESVNDEQVAIVLGLSEGYPLFAVLLARGLARDRDLLTRGDDQSTRWDAARRVLAGSRAEHGDDEQRWRREAEIRAKCLLVVIVTGHLDLAWSELWSRHGEALRQAICEPHEARQVQLAHDSCEKREILRRVGRSNRRYVSPANLSRIILNHFFSGPDDDLGSRLARTMPEFLEHLHVQAERVQAAPEVRQRLAQHAWDEFERRLIADEPLGGFLERLRGLDIAAELLPEQSAQVLAGAVRRDSPDQLAQAKQLRRALRRLFEHLVQLPISAAAFEQIEDALFRMVRVEDEPWFNSAMHIWKSLCLVALSQTHQPWQLRFELLSRRCRAESPDDRRFALEGLAVAVANHEEGLGHSRDTYDWLIPQGPEVWAAKRQAWTLLVSLCDDPAPMVAARAREIVVAQLRGCVGPIGVGVSLLDAIERSVSRWAPDQRMQLSKALAGAKELAGIHRDSAVSIDVELVEAVDKLTRALEPSNFAERLVQQLGNRQLLSTLDDEQRKIHELAGDEALVQEALADPRLLVEQFEWLASAEAIRRRPFLRTLGRRDHGITFLAPLEKFSRARADPRDSLLPWYIEGWAELGDEDQPDQWLMAKLEGGEHQRVAAFTLPFLPPTAKRLRRLIELIESGRAEPSVPPMAYRRWISADSVAPSRELVEAMERQPGLAPVALILANKLLDESLDVDTRARISLVAARLLRSNTREHMPSVIEFDWERVFEKLVDGGHVDDAVSATVELLATTAVHSNLSLVDRVICMLIERGLAAQLWTAVAPMLDAERDVGLEWRVRETGLLSAVDPDMVMAWVGARERRAITVADLLSPHDPTLPALARYLLIRFGGDKEVGSVLAARASSTKRPIHDLTQFKRRQLEHANEWAKDEAPSVRRWALRVAGDLARSIAEAEVQEEVRRKYG